MSSTPDWRPRLLRRFRRWAQKNFPLPYPVRVYLRPPAKLPGMLGYFEFNEDEMRGLIVISNVLTRDSFLDTCCEEWAHARTAYLCDREEDPHHGVFWAEYGRIVGASREHQW